MALDVELVRTTTGDGLRLDGALLEPHGRIAASTSTNTSAITSAFRPTAAILLHGVAGNFYTSSTFEPLIGSLQALDIAPLLVNTRGHDSIFGASLGHVRRRFGAAYETVDDCRQDVAAWVALLKSRGHEQVVLVGHSLGAIKAVYAQAHDSHAEVAAVIAVSAPRLSYAAFMNAPESSSLFWESMHTAEELAANGQGEELFTSKYPFPMLIAASAYLDKYGPAERYNLLNFAAQLKCPALYTYGSKELASGGIAFAGLPEALAALSASAPRTVLTIDGADHLYTGVADTLATCISQWLSERASDIAPHS